MRVSVLGSGSSGGVPVAGAGWGKCNPDNPKNFRLRPSMLVDVDDKRFLIDTSPDLRQQLLNADVTHLDAVLYTHAHADHLNGVDDLRGINRVMNAPLDIYCDALTLQTINERFAYTLTPLAEGADRYYKPVLIPHEVNSGDDFNVSGVAMSVFDQDHGHTRTFGYRIGNFGYSTDLVNLPEEGFDALAGIHTWIVGCFTDRPHVTHVHVEKALGWIERIKPERAILTHLGPDLDFDALSKILPKGVEAAFDGMIVDIPD
ncbi:MAG: MBL fold metallo-hydrolase [Rhodospirillaceae bacterium]|nr:MBL fold metallo-hydrolase [Rhodospirillaceae bacterium]MBT5299568.1 MBL fold metallo-hydrolase [Rhodospirillaceae bacterium]MBT7511857.1 MBL fold metallo-hydrolase [Rhodospirillaceae bacterium]